MSSATPADELAAFDARLRDAAADVDAADVDELVVELWRDEARELDEDDVEDALDLVDEVLGGETA